MICVRIYLRDLHEKSARGREHFVVQCGFCVCWPGNVALPSLLGDVVHADALPGDGSVFGDIDTHQVVAGLGAVALAH